MGFFHSSDILTGIILVLLVAGYFAALVSCILLKSELSINSNRAGKMIPHLCSG